MFALAYARKRAGSTRTRHVQRRPAGTTRAARQFEARGRLERRCGAPYSLIKLNIARSNWSPSAAKRQKATPVAVLLSLAAWPM
jgi:hypothetical protein